MNILLLILLLLFPPIALGQAQHYDKAAPTARGLRAWWTATPGFTGGPFWYDVLGRHPITLTNMGTEGTTSGWAAGTLPRSRGEVRFDGSNDFGITSPSDTSLYPSPFTITLWVKRLATGSDYQLLLGIDGSSRELRIRSSGKLGYAFLGTSYGYSHDEGVAALAIGTWYHVAWSYDSTGRVYVNCVEDFNDSGGGAGTPYPISSTVKFGSNSGASMAFSGVMNHIRVYDRILPPMEICQVMQEDVSVKPLLTRDTPTESLAALIMGALGKVDSFFHFFGP